MEIYVIIPFRHLLVLGSGKDLLKKITIFFFRASRLNMEILHFFRKIRQRLLTENRFSKYLLYAIGEILLVVIVIKHASRHILTEFRNQGVQ